METDEKTASQKPSVSVASRLDKYGICLTRTLTEGRVLRYVLDLLPGEGTAGASLRLDRGLERASRIQGLREVSDGDAQQVVPDVLLFGVLQVLRVEPGSKASHVTRSDRPPYGTAG